MELNQFNWNNGSYETPVVLPEEKIQTLLKAKDSLPNATINIAGHINSESGGIYNHRKHKLKNLYPNLNVHAAGSSCQIHQNADITSHNVYNPDEIPTGDNATAQNTTILKTNSDIGRQGLTMTTDPNDSDFEYGFVESFIDPANINFNPCTYIRSKSHRYVGKHVDGVMKLKQLSDQDGTKFADGSDATAYLTNPDYDVWMKLPNFYYNVIDKVTDGVDDVNTAYVCFQPATNEEDSFEAPYHAETWEYWDGKGLIAVYKGHVIDNDGVMTLHSVSGVEPTRNVNWNNFTVYARNRGKGFRLVTYDAHKVMALLGYGWYGDLDIQAQCGSGTATEEHKTDGTGALDHYRSKTTGLTNHLGMMDTVNLSESAANNIAAGTAAPNNITNLRWYDYNKTKRNIGNGENPSKSNGTHNDAAIERSINFWGLENWFGDVYEIMDDIYGRNAAYLINYVRSNNARLIVTIDGHDVIVDSSNCTDVFVDGNGYLWYTILADDKQTILRVIRTINQNGWIESMYYGDHNDVIPSKVHSAYSHYDDYFYGAGGSGCVGFRSYLAAVSYGGLGFLCLFYDASYASSSFGSRLFYDGDSEIVSNLD